MKRAQEAPTSPCPVGVTVTKAEGCYILTGNKCWQSWRKGCCSTVGKEKTGSLRSSKAAENRCSRTAAVSSQGYVCA